MYIPEVGDYVIWDRPNGDIESGWVYFKGDPVDNGRRSKEGWKPISQYITIETGVREKPECYYTSGKPMRHKMIHTLLLCNRDCWNQLRYVKNRRTNNEVGMYKSQEGRYEDTQ